jgi:hypothetical protein
LIFEDPAGHGFMAGFFFAASIRTFSRFILYSFLPEVFGDPAAV